MEEEKCQIIVLCDKPTDKQREARQQHMQPNSDLHLKR